MARITVEDCVDKYPSRFELVLVASQRARKLHSGEEPTVDKDNDKNTVIALREIADMTIPIEKMKENLIEEYQTVSINDEEEESSDIESINENKHFSKEIKDDPDENSNQQIEKEIKDLNSAEEEELKERFEIDDNFQSSENASSSENDDQEVVS